MADQKFDKETLKKALNMIADSKYSAGSIADRMGSKDAVVDKIIQTDDFLTKHHPGMEDKETLDLYDSLRERIGRQQEVGRQYARTLPNKTPSSNVDILNRDGVIKVGAKSPAAKILEKQSGMIDPHDFQQQQRFQKTSIPNMDGLQKPSIEAAKMQALKDAAVAGEKGAVGMAEKVAGKMKGGKGLGKMAALAAIITAIGKASAGESINPKDLLKSGAEVINPFPIGLDEMTEETNKIQNAGMNHITDALKLENDRKEQIRQARESQALPEALEFGDTLNDMQGIPKRQALMSRIAKK